MNLLTGGLGNIFKKSRVGQPGKVGQNRRGDYTTGTSLPKEQAEILLKEYELCIIDANHLEDSSWTATSILIVATAGGIGLLSASAPGDLYKLVVNVGLSLFSLCIVNIWYRIVCRWHTIQGEIYVRSEDIEKSLGHLRKNLNIREMLEAEKDKKRSVSYAFKRIHWLLRCVWLLFPIVQIAWYVIHVIGLSSKILWLTIK